MGSPICGIIVWGLGMDATHRATQVAAELEQANSLFSEGERGWLILYLDRPLGDGELEYVAAQIDGSAFRLLTISFDNSENALHIQFEATILFLPLVALVLGGLGVVIVYWVLRKEMPNLALPAALGAAGLGSIGVAGAFGRRAWFMGLLGVGLVAGGTYLGWRELFPPPLVMAQVTGFRWEKKEGG